MCASCTQSKVRHNRTFFVSIHFLHRTVTVLFYIEEKAEVSEAAHYPVIELRKQDLISAPSPLAQASFCNEQEGKFQNFIKIRFLTVLAVETHQGEAQSQSAYLASARSYVSFPVQWIFMPVNHSPQHIFINY